MVVVVVVVVVVVLRAVQQDIVRRLDQLTDASDQVVILLLSDSETMHQISFHSDACDLTRVRDHGARVL